MYSFPKAQRLSGYSEVRTLFADGEAFLQYPLSIRFVAGKGNGNVSVLVSCPKRYQKLAVGRNRVKRLIRECYRLQNAQLKSFAEYHKLDVNFAIVYVSKEIVSFEKMQTLIVDVLMTLQHNIRKKCKLSD